jgi:hypothetical protein
MGYAIFLGNPCGFPTVSYWLRVQFFVKKCANQEMIDHHRDKLIEQRPLSRDKREFSYCWHRGIGRRAHGAGTVFVTRAARVRLGHCGGATP